VEGVSTGEEFTAHDIWLNPVFATICQL
jgi:hypothetical protein